MKPKHPSSIQLENETLWSHKISLEKKIKELEDEVISLKNKIAYKDGKVASLYRVLESCISGKFNSLAGDKLFKRLFNQEKATQKIMRSIFK